MNYGYAPLAAGEPVPSLTPAEEPDRYCIQLYDLLARAVPLEGKRVIEVGSGRGGGCAWIHRRHRPAAIRGVDFSRKAVALCRRRHRARGLTFVRGDAERLPLRSGSVDAVVNVESSHCYGSRARFIAQVARVLRPGGHFLYTDFFDDAHLPMIEAMFADSGLATVEARDITANVVRAMELDTKRKRRAIRSTMPRVLAGAFEQFAGLKDSEIHTAFATRRITYRMWVLRKA